MNNQLATNGLVSFHFLTVLALAVLLALGGCAFKPAGPTEVVPPPAETTPRTVTGILWEQYEKWKGTAYKWGGTTKAGVDCSGLMQAVFRDGFGLNLPRTSIEQSQAGHPIPRNAIRAGDLLFFSDRRSDHIGVAVDGQRFLQASTSVGVTISELRHYWLPKLTRVSRVLDTATITKNIQ